jgi:hypothetical protein
MTQRAAVTVLYVSKAKHHELRWTFYFPNPTVMVSSVLNLSSKRQYHTVSVVAPSILDGIMRAAEAQPDEIYMGQMEDLIISRDIPAHQICLVVADYNRNGNWPKSAYVVAVPTTTTPLPIESQYPVPEVFYTTYFGCRGCHPLYLGEKIWRVWDDLQTPGVSVVVPYAASAHELDQVMILGRTGVGCVLTRQQTKAWALLTNRMRRATLNVLSPQGPIDVKDVRANTRTTVAMHRGQLDVDVRVTAVGDLAGWPASVHLSIAELSWIQSVVSRSLIQWCQSAVQTANHTHTDPFGWGRTYLFTHPTLDARYSDDPTICWPIRARFSVTTHLWVTGVNT